MPTNTNTSTVLATLILCSLAPLRGHTPTVTDYLERVKLSRSWHHVDFDTSLQTDKYPDSIRVVKPIMGFEGTDYLTLCRNLYNRYNPSQLLLTSEPTIPKIIHQIWLGSPLPDEFKKYIESWKEKHLSRGWQYKLWTDDDVKDFKLYNQKYFDETPNFGSKADLLRFEILYRYGGVYIDLDFECLAPLDELHHRYDLYTALQPLDSKTLQLGSALMGAKPKHPIIEHYIRNIEHNWKYKGVLMRTGPVPFTKAFFYAAGRGGNRDIAFPPTYFYPQESRQYDLKYDEWIKNGAYAIHHWSKSWLPIAGRRPQFRTIKNEHTIATWNS